MVWYATVITSPEQTSLQRTYHSEWFQFKCGFTLHWSWKTNRDENECD